MTPVKRGKGEEENKVGTGLKKDLKPSCHFGIDYYIISGCLMLILKNLICTKIFFFLWGK